MQYPREKQEVAQVARIRSIKPEFWSSPGIETISPWARLLYVAMWNWADDHGRGTCNLRELAGFAFPYDEDPSVGTSDGFRRTMSEVRGRFGVVFYEVAGRRYYEIPSWDKHQRNERKSNRRHPPSTEGKPWDFMAADLRSDGSSENLRADASEVPTERAEAPKISGQVTGEQGNRGIQHPTGAAANKSRRESRPKADSDSPLTDTQRSKRITDAYAEIEPLSKWPAVNGVVLKAIRSGKYTDDEIREATLRLAKEGRSVTVETLRVELNGLPATRPRSPGAKPSNYTEEEYRSGF